MNYFSLYTIIIHLLFIFSNIFTSMIRHFNYQNSKVNLMTNFDFIDFEF
jgi:hypothetical protein